MAQRGGGCGSQLEVLLGLYLWPMGATRSHGHVSAVTSSAPDSLELVNFSFLDIVAPMSRRKHTVFQANLDGVADYSISLPPAHRPPPPPQLVSSSTSRSSTPGSASIERPSEDRRRIWRELLPIPRRNNDSEGTGSASEPPDISPVEEDAFYAQNDAQETGACPDTRPEGQNQMRAKCYLTSVRRVVRFCSSVHLMSCRMSL